MEAEGEQDPHLPDPESKPQESKEKPYPLKILYCQICGLPPQFCMFEKKKATRQKCKQWLIKTHPEVYKSLYDEEKKEGEGDKQPSPQEVPEQEEKKEKKVHFSEEVEKTKQTKPKKGATAIAGVVTITKLKRGGKKFVTLIDGLDYYEVDLKDAAKALRKRFACGTSVENKALQLQGGFDQELIEFLNATFPKIEQIKTVDEGKQKKKGK